ncbi:Nudix hydrolase domain-containing protein [Balamuthia mandrillaris]
MAQRQQLEGKVDAYNGVLVQEQSLPSDLLLFGELLERALAEWKRQGRRGVWLRIPIAKSHLISIAAEFDFAFHHTGKDYVMMTKWLPEGQPNTLPDFCSHYVGVGGFVVNERNEVLVIKEKNGPITGFWKFPGGMVEAGEELWQAAIREVKEETGIDTEFQSILCFRQNVTASFGRSDLYFVCKLKPLSTNIQMQASEIADCKWMPMKEFMELPHYKGLYRKMLEIAESSATADPPYVGIIGESLPVVFRPGSEVLYYHSSSSSSSSLSSSASSSSSKDGSSRL